MGRRLDARVHGWHVRFSAVQAVCRSQHIKGSWGYPHCHRCVLNAKRSAGGPLTVEDWAKWDVAEAAAHKLVRLDDQGQAEDDQPELTDFLLRGSLS